ncbi:MAG: hypothetical protein QXU18_08100 [Thermoplasmatales archaeon]
MERGIILRSDFLAYLSVQDFIEKHGPEDAERYANLATLLENAGFYWIGNNDDDFIKTLRKFKDVSMKDPNFAVEFHDFLMKYGWKQIAEFVALARELSEIGVTPDNAATLTEFTFRNERYIIECGNRRTKQRDRHARG